MGSWFAFVDISKAYDNVDLDILNQAILSLNPPQNVLEQWRQELRDLRMLNMNVFGTEIKRKNGLPQGSELAPALFNIYTTRILRDLDENGLLDNQVQVAIFADNWVLYSIHEKLLRKRVLEINAFIFANYKIQFSMDEAEIVKIVEIADGQPIILDSSVYKPFKFLGVNWKVYNNRVYFDQNDYHWNFPKIKLSPGFLVFSVIKKYIVPKFRYYYNYLTIVNPTEAQRYRSWFKKQLNYYLQKNLNMLNIQDKMIEQLVSPTEPNKIWRKFLGPYLATNREICNSNNKLTLQQMQLLGKLKDAAKVILDKDYKAGIYQVSNFLFKFRHASDYFEHNEKNLNQHQRNRTWMIIDILYFAITAEKRISTQIFQEQEKYMNKTLRKRSYKFF